MSEKDIENKQTVLAAPESNGTAAAAAADPGKNGNPLSIRVEPYYKEKFETLTKELGLSKKLLFENLILSYLEKDQQNRRESHLNLTNEINLITANLDELLTIFTKMAVKSQDTIGSLKSDYSQQICNLETRMNASNHQITALSEKNQLLEAANQGYNHSKKQLEQTIEALERAIDSKNEEIKNGNLKYLELLEQLNQLRQLERENLLLKTEAAQAAQDFKNLQGRLEAAQTEGGQLQRKAAQLQVELTEIHQKQKEAWQEREAQLRRSAELDQKTALLQLQEKYNYLQAENLRCLGEMNQKTVELTELRFQLRKADCNNQKVITGD
jgi:chromosome segregation ATPase